MVTPPLGAVYQEHFAKQNRIPINVDLPIDDIPPCIAVVTPMSYDVVELDGIALVGAIRVFDAEVWKQ